MNPARTAETTAGRQPEPEGPATEFAAAKVNLALHVTGRRPDGYHLLDTLAVFATIGDTLTATPAASLDLAITGPFAPDLSQGTANGDNLVIRAARALADVAGASGHGARLTLDKRLPVAGGIGGGSADAAAALRLLNRFWGLGLAPPALAAIGARLGADVPMCLLSRPLRATGVGEILTPVAGLPALPLVLVNPGVPVSTAEVFRRLRATEDEPLPALPAAFPGPAAVADWLAGAGNSLEAPALGLAPSIGEALTALRAGAGCLLGRMSGSGSTCFGIYPDGATAEAAAEAIRRARRGWWVASTLTGAS